MKKLILFIAVGLLLVGGACRDDESYRKDAPPVPEGQGRIQLALTGRAGDVIGDSLVEYVDALNLLLFRENGAGNYVLYRSLTFNKEELQALTPDEREAEAGFTLFQQVTFDSLPLAHYRIVGLGNALDSLGNALPDVALRGITPGTGMAQVIASVLNNAQAPRFFWGITPDIAVGASQTDYPELRMYRKVAMFSLTLLKIPDVVDQINLTFGHVYGAFNMAGNFVTGSGTVVYTFNTYKQNVQDSITLNYVMLPTVAGDSTTIEAGFYLSGEAKETVTFPRYVLKPNTITKVQATINPDQSGDAWKVDLRTLITVNVEWNVDQEPPITI